MSQAVKITYRHLSSSTEVTTLVQKYANKLSCLSEKITRCRVVIDLPHRNQRKGRQFRVRVAVSVPGKFLVAGRSPIAAARHSDLRVAIGDAFRAMEQMILLHISRKKRKQALPPRWRRTHKTASLRKIQNAASGFDW